MEPTPCASTRKLRKREDHGPTSSIGKETTNKRARTNIVTDEEMLQMLGHSANDEDFEGLCDLSDDDNELWEPLSSDDESDEILDPPQETTEHFSGETWTEVDRCSLRNITFTGIESYTYRPEYPDDRSKLEPIHVFKTFINEEVVRLIVTETNRNAENFLENNVLSRGARARRWKDTTEEEMMRFFGIILYMGLVPYPNLCDYWSKSELYSNNPVSKTMPRNRFQLLLRFLHFEDNETADKTDRLYKIRKLVDMLLRTFSSEYVPGEIVAVDESMIPFRGRLLFLQYIPSKSHKYGIKVFKLCNQHGYTLKAIIYTGRLYNIRQNLAEQVVLDLMEDYRNHGRTVITDNYYTSVPLARKLLNTSTHLLGTIRKNRKHLPAAVTKSKLKEGQIVGKESNGIVVAKWHDKRDVLYLSTKHGVEMTATGKINRKSGEEIRKPTAISDYNKGKQGVDVSDQMASYYTPIRKTIKWYHKVAFELMFNTALVNSFFLFNKFSENRFPHIKNFRENIIINLLNSSKSNTLRSVPSTRSSVKTHVLVENTKKDKRNRVIRSRCCICYPRISKEKGRDFAQKNVRKIKYKCNECDKFYCLQCFQQAH